MRSSDFEFDNKERNNGYIYVNEDKLESEITELLLKGNDVETLEIPEDISGEAYLNMTVYRNRVLQWYPFASGTSILEVGAGYGALTEYLCANLDKVSVYERKRERLNVIRTRCDKYGNLSCYSGKLEEADFRQQFDYILVHDIFAFARKFFKGNNPNADMLVFLKKFLKRQGRLLLITENRLGLKYFAGAVEDYSQQFFWGLKSFDEDERIRTFSQAELMDILRKSGFVKSNWYYLYPDMVNTLEVYTDEIRSHMMYGTTYPDYESCADRYEFFDERRMFHTFYKEGIEYRFANAFFVECVMEDVSKEIAYANTIDDFIIKKSDNLKGFIYNDKNKLPEGMRLDCYLMGKVQEVVNCNLGPANPFIKEVYQIFEELNSYMKEQVHCMEDFYYNRGKVSVIKTERKNVYGFEYYRWKLGYSWYLNNVMCYRNAKRRILLESILEVLTVDLKQMENYMNIFQEESKNRYIIPRLSQNMFDFEAEDAKDMIVLDEKSINKTTVKDRLKVLCSGMAGE